MQLLANRGRKAATKQKTNETRYLGTHLSLTSCCIPTCLSEFRWRFCCRRFHTGSRRGRWSSGWRTEPLAGSYRPTGCRTIPCWTAQCSWAPCISPTMCCRSGNSGRWAQWRVINMSVNMMRWLKRGREKMSCDCHSSNRKLTSSGCYLSLKGVVHIKMTLQRGPFFKPSAATIKLYSAPATPTAANAIDMNIWGSEKISNVKEYDAGCHNIPFCLVLAHSSDPFKVTRLLQKYWNGKKTKKEIPQDSCFILPCDCCLFFTLNWFLSSEFGCWHRVQHSWRLTCLSCSFSHLLCFLEFD